MDYRALEIFTDGSSKVYNNCDASCAFIVVYPEHAAIEAVEQAGISYGKSKIGAMETEAINRALEWIYDNLKHLKDFE